MQAVRGDRSAGLPCWSETNSWHPSLDLTTASERAGLTIDVFEILVSVSMSVTVRAWKWITYSASRTS